MVFGNNILERVFGLNGFAQIFFHADVPEGFHGAQKLSLSVAKQGRGNADRKLSAVRVDDVYFLVDNGLPGFHGHAQTAVFFADVRFQNILAHLADRLLAGNPGDLLRGPVERGDPPILINGKNTVSDGIQNDVLSAFRIEGQRFWNPLNFHTGPFCDQCSLMGPGGFPRRREEISFKVTFPPSITVRRPFTGQLLRFTRVCPARFSDRPAPGSGLQEARCKPHA